ncbi:hypothetical protein E2C01_004294 [Portunus trituberculatus]|uniref:Uncharacterized protein n=1 Tax=Portunus trituberculatus TaxID=210409 RepID=A0A5B7CW08_PORTR|nr:hypothetical protein [Portunus trituberculatus]
MLTRSPVTSFGAGAAVFSKQSPDSMLFSDIQLKVKARSISLFPEQSVARTSRILSELPQTQKTLPHLCSTERSTTDVHCLHCCGCKGNSKLCFSWSCKSGNSAGNFVISQNFSIKLNYNALLSSFFYCNGPSCNSLNAYLPKLPTFVSGPVKLRLPVPVYPNSAIPAVSITLTCFGHIDVVKAKLIQVGQRAVLKVMCWSNLGGSGTHLLLEREKTLPEGQACFSPPSVWLFSESGTQVPLGIEKVVPCGQDNSGFLK